MATFLGISTVSIAAGNIGNPNYLVIMMETDTSQVNFRKRLSLDFCPVDKNRNFKASCLDEGQGFPGYSKAVYDIVDNDEYEYIIGWRKSKGEGLYAFGSGRIAGSGFGGTEIIGPGTHTQVAVLGSGVVAVITRPFTMWKGGYGPSLKRAKAVFKKQYGAELTRKMKFVVFKAAPVECKLKKSLFQYQITLNSCVLK